jgi:hypothetical protein
MPLQNRVTPFGEIVATPERGLMYGNRGCLHDPNRRIVRGWQVRRWIGCVLEFRGRHRVDQMPPGRYTGLYFLDEATAFAAGHRPCAECRRPDYERFQEVWRDVHPGASTRADDMDLVLHAERVDGTGRRAVKRTHPANIRDLPDGAMFAEGERAYLVLGDDALPWSPGGYGEPVRPTRGRRTVDVLTPPSIVRAIGAGFAPMVHPSASRPTRRSD